ncbi:hypothetical protein [Ralstonia pickettii]|uniref:hypothetical protein n=1 Tax=Ralstonia pickettii TaxID=329 RepID=UPI0004684058|nr:hypothetical protein [Ralstonia pickettii]
MHATLKTFALIALGISAGQALAGPDWDAINRARAAAHQHAANSSASPSKEALLAQCNEMFKQMGTQPTGSNKDGQPVASPKGALEVK